MARLPKYIFIGDDFTGASDTLATLSRAGLRCRLFLDFKTALKSKDLADFDAIGIATATRSMGPAEIVDALAPLGQYAIDDGPSVIHYKVCSTFDSSPLIGSIGVAINAFKRFWHNTNVLISGGQPSLGRYCIFSHLFAKAADGEVYRIDRHPTMANHPVTPNSESDLRTLLNTQGAPLVVGIHKPDYAAGVEDITNKVHALWEKKASVLFDAETTSDVALIGNILTEGTDKPVLAVGSSSIAEAYLLGSGHTAKSSHGTTAYAPQKPVFLLVGSRSPVSAQQVENAQGYHKILIQPDDIEAGQEELLNSLIASCLEHIKQGHHVMAIVGEGMNHSLSRVEVARFTADLVSNIAFSGLIDRLCIAGGDTSSLALQSLGVESLSFRADVEPGLCLCRVHSKAQDTVDGLEVILKGGQMGTPRLFDTFTDPIL